MDISEKDTVRSMNCANNYRLVLMNKVKPDYLAEVRRPTKWLAISLLLIGVLVSTGCFLLATAILIMDINGAPLGPVWGCIILFGVVSVVSGWMLIRLLREARAVNGKTMMPVLFIQLFGVVFLIGLCAAAIANGKPLLFGEAFAVALAMIGIRRLILQSTSDAVQSG